MKVIARSSVSQKAEGECRERKWRKKQSSLHYLEDGRMRLRCEQQRVVWSLKSVSGEDGGKKRASTL